MLKSVHKGLGIYINQHKYDDRGDSNGNINLNIGELGGKFVYLNKKLTRRGKTLVLCIVLIFGISIIASTQTEVDKYIEKKAELILEDANQDIINSFSIGKSGLSKSDSSSISYIDFNEFRVMEFEDINELDKDIATEFNELESSPVGSTYPMLLINQEQNKIVVLYKESDGTNVARYSERIDGIWVRNEIRAKGTPILDINDIDI